MKKKSENYAKVYLLAAQDIDKRRCMYSCQAITKYYYLNPSDKSWEGARKAYQKLFELGDGYNYTGHSPNLLKLWDLSEEQQKDLRVWMLLMAAAIEEAGGL
jgi:hypothetical protein